MNSLENYYSRPELSQSKLKRLLGHNPSKFLEEFGDESKSMTIGNIVDCLITHPETFNEDFYIFDVKMPSDTIIGILNEYHKIAGDVESEPLGCKKTLIQCGRNANYYNNKKDDQLYDTICNAGIEYYKKLKNVKGRFCISMDEYNLSKKIEESIRNKFNHILTDENIHFQVDLYGKYDDVDIKGLIDFMIVDKEKNEIKIFDLKTSYDETAYFSGNLRKYRYDIQMAWYKMLVEQNYPGYAVKCYFLVESTSIIGNPILYECDENIIHIGMNGAIKHTGILYIPPVEGTILIEGIKHLMEKYKYYSNAENGFSEDMQIAKHNNTLSLNWFGSDDLLSYGNQE